MRVNNECRKICLHYRMTKIFAYARGGKKCTNCDVYIKWDASNNCPCCNQRLKIQPREGKYKDKMYQYHGKEMPRH